MRDSRRSPAVPLLIGAIVVMLLPVLYALSVGPALWLLQRDYMTREAFDPVYQPLFNGSEAAGTDDWLVAYLWWWKDHQ